MPRIKGPRLITSGCGGPAGAMSEETTGGPGTLENRQVIEGQTSRTSQGGIEATPDENGADKDRAPVDPLDSPVFEVLLSEQQSSLIQANGDDPQIRVLYGEWVQARDNYLVSADAMASTVVKMNRLSLEMSQRIEEVESRHHPGAQTSQS